MVHRSAGYNTKYQPRPQVPKEIGLWFEIAHPSIDTSKRKGLDNTYICVCNYHFYLFECSTFFNYNITYICRFCCKIKWLFSRFVFNIVAEGGSLSFHCSSSYESGNSCCYLLILPRQYKYTKLKAFWKTLATFFVTSFLLFPCRLNIRFGQLY